MNALLVAIGALISISIGVSDARAASFDLLSSRKFGSWEGNHYSNQGSGRRFCAAETTNQDGTTLRVNYYNDNKEAFLEVYNPSWSYREGGVSFSFTFESGFSVELRGKSWGDSFTYDFLERDKMLAILGLLAEQGEARLTNSNGEEIGRFSPVGARDAIAVFDQCSGGL